MAPILLSTARVPAITVEAGPWLHWTARSFQGRVFVFAVNDREEKVAEAFLEKLGDLGLMGMTVPARYGGSDAGSVALSVVLQEIARNCPATALMVSVNHLVAAAIFTYGTENQKERFLSPLAGGRFTGAIAFTEPVGGSSPRVLKSFSIKEGDRYVLKGSKQWVTSGSRADIILTFAHLRDGTSRENLGLNAFLLPKNTTGLHVGTLEKKMGIRASDTAELIFEACPLTGENLLGREGQGVEVFNHALNSGRLGVASQCVGIGQACLDEAVAFAGERLHNERPIHGYQAVRLMLAEMATELEAARYLTFGASQRRDDGREHTREASMAKYYASEMANRVAYKALQIHGAHGYSKDSKIERLYRDARATTIYEGTSEVQKIIIAREVLREKS